MNKDELVESVEKKIVQVEILRQEANDLVLNASRHTQLKRVATMIKAVNKTLLEIAEEAQAFSTTEPNLDSVAWISVKYLPYCCGMQEWVRTIEMWIKHRIENTNCDCDKH